ncbi:hypothetical protein NECAME_01694 [Necator americanus]|uniref:Uncharacterized protein n=1 Tax=Necator americanus TaxID=51031 RepID=W2TS07_NECAM|nr:hypothetical protein NECAME_01694 [Necator americanus]ETN83901.1 hypothetical protein NECAME_01694 [Necator americanus]
MLPGCVASTWSVVYFHEIKIIEMDCPVDKAEQFRQHWFFQCNGFEMIRQNSMDIDQEHYCLGFTAQMFMCIGAFMVSTAVHAFLHFPGFHGFAMFGGVLWCTANAFAIQIMNRLGMALSILVWNTVSCLTGWATSRYGLFGLNAAVPASLTLNYLGIIALIAGGVMYLFVKNNIQERTDVERKGEKVYPVELHEDQSDKKGFLAAMLSGLFYGTMRGAPWINPKAALPSMAGGALLAMGMVLFVIAIDNLDQAIAYPICAMSPGLIVSLWSIFYFREITGRRNLTWLSIAYSLTLVGVALVTISREVSLF